MQKQKALGRSLLELGAGVGLVGAACAACGARAVLTDWEGALPLLRRNAELLAQRGAGGAPPVEGSRGGLWSCLSWVLVTRGFNAEANGRWEEAMGGSKS